MSFTQSSKLFPLVAPIDPLVCRSFASVSYPFFRLWHCSRQGLWCDITVKPIWQTSTSAPALAIFLLSSTLNTYGVVSISCSCASRIISTSLSNDMPVSSRLARNCPSINPTVGKFWTPAKPNSLSCLRKAGMFRKGSVAHTPAMTGVFFTTGRTSLAYSIGLLISSSHEARNISCSFLTISTTISIFSKG